MRRRCAFSLGRSGVAADLAAHLVGQRMKGLGSGHADKAVAEAAALIAFLNGPEGARTAETDRGPAGGGDGGAVYAVFGMFSPGRR